MTEIVPILDAEGSFMTLREAFGVADESPWTLPFHAFLVRGDDWTALIDTGVGPSGPDPFLPDRQGWLGNTVAREAIDVVLFTHMHVDHVGWNMHDGEPFFPRARYIGRREDYELFTSARPDRPYIRDQLIALRETGRLELVEADVTPLPGLRLEHAPGHTPGHCIVRFGDDAVLLGDLAVHELQLADPDAAYVFEDDAASAAAARRRLLPELAVSGAAVGLGHLRPPLGRLEAVGEGFAWRPID
ncbi:MAG TPA: MBL fold metallo-hydrolase [Gaiellaceae bacterium]|jgi:glyoxylase-like metal-dependent hydrolase (beta-lactamase superfamily II)